MSVPSPIDIERATVNAAVATAVRPSERRMNPDAILPGRPPRRVSRPSRAGPRSTSASPVASMSPSRTPNEPAMPATTPAPGSARTPEARRGQRAPGERRRPRAAALVPPRGAAPEQLHRDGPRQGDERHQRAEQPGDAAEGPARGRDPPRPGRRRRAEEEVEGADRAADGPGEQAGQQVPERPAEGAAGHAEQQDLRAEGRRDLAAPGAEAPQHAGVVAPAHDGEHRGVVDEEHPDEQGEQREGLQVDAEGPEHRLHRERPLAAGLHEEPRAPAPPEAGLVVEDEVDPVHDARGPEQPLRLPDVHHRERLARRAGEQPREPQPAAGGRERCAGGERERRGEAALHEHRRRVAERARESGRGRPRLPLRARTARGAGRRRGRDRRRGAGPAPPCRAAGDGRGPGTARGPPGRARAPAAGSPRAGRPAAGWCASRRPGERRPRA